MIIVAYIPYHRTNISTEEYFGTKVIHPEWGGNQHWSETSSFLYKYLSNNGVKLLLYHELTSSPSVIIFDDLPDKPNEIQSVRERFPNTPFILILRESPLHPFRYLRDNHKIFDLTLTYHPTLSVAKNYLHFWLPQSFPRYEYFDKSFSERKHCVLLNTNHYRGPLTGNSPLQFLTSELKFRRNGWKVSITNLLKHEKKFIYNERRKFARVAEKFNDFLEIYGKNWQSMRYSWFYKFFPKRTFNPVADGYEGDKLELFSQYRFVLAFENYKGNIGYISEKIFDAFYGGSVPIYLGDEMITNYIPADCFIDVRSFRNYEEVIAHCISMSEIEWEGYRSKIKNFLMSSTAKEFYPDSYAKTLLKAIKLVS